MQTSSGWPGEGTEGLTLLGHTQNALGLSTAQARAHPRAWPAQ